MPRGVSAITVRDYIDQQLEKRDPNFSPATNAQQYATASDKNKVNLLLRSSALLNRMQSAEEALNAYAKGDIQPLNKLMVSLGQKVGDPKSSIALLNQTLVSDEASKIIGSGQGSDKSLEMGKELADPTLGPAAVAANMKVVRQYIMAFRKEYMDAMGPFGKMYQRPEDTAPVDKGQTAPVDTAEQHRVDDFKQMHDNIKSDTVAVPAHTVLGDTLRVPEKIPDGTVRRSKKDGNMYKKVGGKWVLQQQ
jgi:hypothetical protein